MKISLKVWVLAKRAWLQNLLGENVTLMLHTQPSEFVQSVRLLNKTKLLSNPPEFYA